MPLRISRIKPNIYECLSQYADGHYVETLEGFVSEIVKLSKQNHAQVLDYQSVLKAFRLNRETDLAVLSVEFPAIGLSKSCGHWMLNVRQFVVCAQGQSSIMKRRPTQGVPAKSIELLI